LIRRLEAVAEESAGIARLQRGVEHVGKLANDQEVSQERC
jgi:hypothetical protein